jgi:hypothetical protein
MLPEEIEAMPDFEERFGKKYLIKKDDFKYQSTGLSRASVVFDLLDYDIKIFGSPAWKGLAPFDSKVLKAYDSRFVYTLEHNELIYNRSKIALNCSHQQSILGYPWRVLDILASSSVLMSSYSPLLVEDFPNIEFPFFRSKLELLNLTERLLGDEYFREDFSLQCNAAIDEGFRWHHRFSLISGVSPIFRTIF